MKYNKIIVAAFVALSSIGVNYSCSDHEHSESHDHSKHNHEIDPHAGHNHDGHNHAGHNHKVDPHAGHNHAGHNHAGHGHDGHNHADAIEFSEQKAKHFGVVTAKITRQSFNDIIKVSGEIEPAQGELSVISAKSSGILRLNSNAVVGKQLGAGSSIGSISSQNVTGGDANETARINYEAAKRELDRITPLYNDKIITEKDYNQAKQVYEQAKAAMVNKSGVGSSATSNISGTITEIMKKDGEFVEVGTPIAVVSKNSKLILRADLPNRYSNVMHTITSAQFKPAYSEEVYDLAKLNGKIVSNKNLSVVTPGYIPVNFEFNNSASIVPGTFADVYLIGATKPNCIVLPIEALTEEQGYYFVYQKLHAGVYTKKEVKLGLNNGVSVEILSGLKGGENIVVKGATIVKLASQSNAVPGHSHEH